MWDRDKRDHLPWASIQNDFFWGGALSPQGSPPLGGALSPQGSPPLGGALSPQGSIGKTV